MNEYKYYQIPSPFPTLARGIFTIDIDDLQGSESTGTKTEGDKNYRIVARGYDKFFNIGEVPWTTVVFSLLSSVLDVAYNTCFYIVGGYRKVHLTPLHAVLEIQWMYHLHCGIDTSEIAYHFETLARSHTRRSVESCTGR